MIIVLQAEGDVVDLSDGGKPVGDQYEVEKIVQHRGETGGGLPAEYLVQWKGFASCHNSWEPAASMGGAADFLQQYCLDHGLVTALPPGERLDPGVSADDSGGDFLNTLNHTLDANLCPFVLFRYILYLP